MRKSKMIGLRALKLTVAGISACCLTVAVLAAPLTITPKSKIWGSGSGVEHTIACEPLARGPAMQLCRAGPGEDEDCIRAARMMGPDGRIYVTRGLICAN